MTALMLAGALLLQFQLPAQGFLKKLKETADKALEKKVNEKVGIEDKSKEQEHQNKSGSERTGKATNKSGAGLKSTTPPDVAEQISDANKAYTAKNYNDARYSVQQALLGVELQIGKEILKSLPATVSGLPSDSTNDRVVSTNWGWANLTIARTYNKADKELNISIGNNQLYSGLTALYFNSSYSMQTDGQKENIKQIRVKGNKAIIQYDASDGYSVIVPLGQSGVIAWTGVNFATEDEMMAAVNAFDIDKVKSLLGEK